MTSGNTGGPDLPGSGTGLEEVRRQLRALGYLRSPVDRFILGGLRGRPSTRAVLVSTSIRVGLVGGPLFGGLFLLVLIYHNYPHLYRFLDLTVLYLYSAAVAGVFLLLSHFLVSWSLEGGWRKGRMGGTSPFLWSQRMGFLLSGLLGLYLGWRWILEQGRSGELLPLSGRLVLLALILGTGVWVGSILTRGFLGSFLVASSPRWIPGPRRRFPIWAALSFLPVAAVLLVGSLLTGNLPPGETGFPASLTLTPVEGRLILLGIDGLGWRDLPEIQSVRGIAVPLEPVSEKVPPAVWTSLMTGMGADRHGIRSIQAMTLMGVRTPLRDTLLFQPLQDAMNFLLPGFRPVERHPVNSSLRRAKTVWEILAEGGRWVAALNWWATWPARPAGRGILMTERAYFKLLAGGPPEQETYPPELLGELRNRFPDDRNRARDLAGPAVASVSLDGSGGEIFRRALMGDAYQLQMAARILEETPVEELFLYLPGLDVVQVELLSGLDRLPIRAVRRRMKALEAYYRFLDHGVQAIANRLSGNDLLVLVGDPGRLQRDSRSGHPDAGGFLLLVGNAPGIAPAEAPGPGELDVAPTLLVLRGFPPSEEMPGRPLFVVEGISLERIPSYGRPSTRGSPFRKSPFDEDMIEQLRSLGYLH